MQTKEKPFAYHCRMCNAEHKGILGARAYQGIFTAHFPIEYYALPKCEICGEHATRMEYHMQKHQ